MSGGGGAAERRQRSGVDVELLAQAWCSIAPFRAGEIRSGDARTQDAIDALVDKRGLEGLRAVLGEDAQRVIARAAEGGPFNPSTVVNEPAQPAKPEGNALELHGIVPIASIPRERIDWAWKGRFAFGKQTDVSGDPGDGKSLMLMALAAQITRGLALPFGSERVRDACAVLYLSAEDDAADTIRPRFEAAGGDVSLLHVQRDDKHLVLPAGAKALGEIVKRLSAAMVIIDPLFSYIGDLDPNAYSSAVVVCDELKRIASAEHCIVATIRHLNKALGSAARYRAGGSIGWQAKPRVALSLGRDSDNKDVRILTFVKGNVGKEPRAATFRVDEVISEGEGVARVLWGDERTVSADEVLGTESAAPKGPNKTDGIAAWIRDRLLSLGEEGIAAAELLDEAVRGGFMKASDRGTFYRARAKLGRSIVEFQLDPDRPRDPIRWRLATTEPGDP